MTELKINDPSWLRQQAAACRELARSAGHSDETRDLLLIEASEREADAKHLEKEASVEQASA